MSIEVTLPFLRPIAHLLVDPAITEVTAPFALRHRRHWPTSMRSGCPVLNRCLCQPRVTTTVEAEQDIKKTDSGRSGRHNLRDGERGRRASHRAMPLRSRRRSFSSSTSSTSCARSRRSPGDDPLTVTSRHRILIRRPQAESCRRRAPARSPGHRRTPAA
jgi:hypothetical protein